MFSTKPPKKLNFLQGGQQQPRNQKKTRRNSYKAKRCLVPPRAEDAEDELLGEENFEDDGSGLPAHLEVDPQESRETTCDPSSRFGIDRGERGAQCLKVAAEPAASNHKSPFFFHLGSGVPGLPTLWEHHFGGK